jgi:predicted transcriptional regulator
MDYDSFIIISSIGAHYLKNNSSKGSDWDSVWEMTRPKKIEESYNKKKLTIFALSNIVGLPKETVRRKVEALKKRKLISHSTNIGLMPTEKIEELMKPFALSELKSLSKFLQALKKHKALDQLLSF